jgi:hypothetical protein
MKAARKGQGTNLRVPDKIMVFFTTYQIEGVSIDTPEDKGCQEGTQVLACPVEGNLE